MEDILTFTKPETRWLSNMAYVDVTFRGITYPSTENMYQALKYVSDDTRQWIASLTPSQAKQYSRENPLDLPDWEDKKIDIMYTALKKKFSQEPFKSKLLATGDCHIEEGNWWGDKFWGVDIKTRVGDNNLGKLIMSVRNELKQAQRNKSKSSSDS